MTHRHEEYRDEAHRNPDPHHFGSMCGGLDEGHEEMEDTLDVPYCNAYEMAKPESKGYDQSGMK